MTIQELYKEGIFRLKQARIAEAELDAWYLLEYVTGISRTMYYLKQAEPAEEQAAERYFDCISRRAQRISASAYYWGAGIYGIAIYCQ